DGPGIKAESGRTGNWRGWSGRLSRRCCRRGRLAGLSSGRGRRLSDDNRHGLNATHAVQLDGAGRADVERGLIQVAEFCLANNVRNQHKDGFGFTMLGVCLAEEIAENGYL